MTPLQFVYWLQGSFELGKLTTLDEEQVQEVKNHLALVLEKVTPQVQLPLPWPTQVVEARPVDEWTITCSTDSPNYPTVTPSCSKPRAC